MASLFNGLKDKFKEKMINNELAVQEKILVAKYEKLEQELEKEYEERLQEQVKVIESRFIEETNMKLLIVCREYQKFFNEKLKHIEKIIEQVDYQADQFNAFIAIQIEAITSKVDQIAQSQSHLLVYDGMLREVRKLYAAEPKNGFFKKLVSSKSDVKDQLVKFDGMIAAVSQSYKLSSLSQVQKTLNIDNLFLVENNLLSQIRTHYIDQKEIEGIKNFYINTVECCVCLEQTKADRVWSGCGHTNTCRNCSASLKACPICRKPGKLINLYM